MLSNIGNSIARDMKTDSDRQKLISEAKELLQDRMESHK